MSLVDIIGTAVFGALRLVCVVGMFVFRGVPGGDCMNEYR